VSVRVAQLVTELDPGGAERVVYELATGLDRERFDPVVISLQPATGEVAEWLARADVPVRSIDMRSRLDLRAKMRLVRLLRAERVGLLHTHLVHATYLGRRAARRAGVGAVVSTVHLVERAWRPWRSMADRLTSGASDAIVCVSDSAREQYLKRVGVRPDKVRVIHNGIDLARFSCSRGAEDRAAAKKALGLPAPISGGTRVIVSLGRLRRQKGHDVALRAMAIVARRVPDAVMLVVGDGPERAKLKALHARLGLEGKAVFVGQRPDVARVLAAADCLVAPSRYEGFGLAAAEAMASGLPVIASRIDSLPEVIADDVSGLLVPPGDPGALAAAIERVLGDDELAARLGRAARERVRERFTLETMLGAYTDLYEEVLAAKGGAQ
jgi:glycosyltransferase involved in cell wall biosynthesis